MIWSIQNTEQVQAVTEIEHSRSERAVAIVCGAIVEQRLEMSLKWRLRQHDNTHKLLFRPSGALGTFASKVDLGYLLYMYDKPTWQVLLSICTIRNKFAHNIGQSFAFGDAEFKGAIGNLVLHKSLTFYPNPFSNSGFTKVRLRKPKNNKQIFVANVKLALIELIRDMSRHHAFSNQGRGGEPITGTGFYLASGKRQPRA